MTKRWIDKFGRCRALAAAVLLGMGACSPAEGEAGAKSPAISHPEGEGVARAYFAGGCFWCMEPPFEKRDGVYEVVSGYMGGSSGNANYSAVSSGRTNHVEAVEVAYDPDRIGYGELLDIFWRSIDPTQTDGQFADRGRQYMTYIYPTNEEEKAMAEASKKQLAESGKFDKPIATRIVMATPFHPAEKYHQDYYKKNPAHYNAYRIGSGRAGFLERTWGNEGN